MKGRTTLVVTKETVIEALQLYFDGQLAVTHEVVDVETEGYPQIFKIKIDEVEEHVIQPLLAETLAGIGHNSNQANGGEPNAEGSDQAAAN